MNKPNRVLYLGLAPLMILGLASCRKGDNNELSAELKAKLVKIADAPDVCPAKLCPAGTKIYANAGWLQGEVIRSSPAINFPSGTTKPGMYIGKPGGEGFLHDIAATESAGYCVLPRSAQDQLAQKETP